MDASRGFTIAAIICVAAVPLARLFAIPQATWAFYWLALVPLFKGLVHQDVMRLQRDLRFKRSIAVDVAGNAVATLVAWPLAAWLGNYSVILWLLVLQGATAMVTSQILAVRPYRWSFNRHFAARLFRFGWPLLLNGMLLFGILQGDRLIIGTVRPMAELGVYAVAFSLAMMPTSVVAKVASPLLLPVISKGQNSITVFSRQYRLGLQAYLMAAMGIATGFIIAGNWLVRFLYGAKYAQAGELVGILAAMHCIRLVRAWMVLAAIAKGDTKNSAIASGVRALSLIGTVAVAFGGGSLFWIGASGVVGELLALTASITRFKFVHNLPVGLTAKPLGLAVIWAAMAALLAPHIQGVLGLPISLCVFASYVAAALLTFSDFRGEAMNLLRHTRAANTSDVGPLAVTEAAA